MKRSSPKPTFISTITIKEYFVNRKMKHLDIGCQIKGCPNKARFLIRSLTRELQGEEKWLSVCVDTPPPEGGGFSGYGARHLRALPEPKF